jgi:hypothetical protein
MIFRLALVLAAGTALAACQPAIPDSGRGVGFDSSFEAEQRQREAALTGSLSAEASGNGAFPAPASVSSTALASADDGSAEATAAETARVLAATRPGASNGVGNDAASNSGVLPVNASPSNPPPAVLNGAGISNENNFDAVSGQRSIDDDAARIAANRAQYQVVQPEALPERTDSGPNIVAYALSTSHAPGTQIYKRIGFNKANKYARACGEYSHPDQAQIAFLEAGGPERDRKGMDPDGDGFACEWDPTPFRRATQG